MEGRKLNYISSLALLLLIVLSMFFFSSLAECSKKRSRKPCKSLVVYFHDILYNSHNIENATSAIVASPPWADRSKLGPYMHFGDVIVFDDPITLDSDLLSEPVGRAQGMSMYDKKDDLVAFFAFSLVLNSTDHKGNIVILGADRISDKTRDIPIVGGTGDFFMSRGIATFTTDNFDGEAYFRIKLDINIYDCY